MDIYDHIIVGAGSAGSVLANRLSADPRRRVLVLEAGGWDHSPWIWLPIGYGKAYYDARINWKYTTEPVPGLGGRTSYWPRGKVIGGSSSINAMVYVRGHPQDFDDWEAAGATGWGWADVAPYFQRLERWAGGADAVRGGTGPLPVADICDEAHPLCESFFASAEAAGIARTADYNGATMEGTGYYQLTVDGGRRASTARAYLKPALRRRNLTLLTRAHVVGLRLEDGRITGVRYRKGGTEREVQATHGVILSAGAVGTPMILERAGIGDPALLAKVGIAPRHALPAVGRHLQDHVGVDFHFQTSCPTLNQVLRPWLGRLKAAATYAARRGGPLSLSINQAGGFVRFEPGNGYPDLQLYFSPVSYTRAPVGQRPMMQPDPFPGLLIGLSTCRPKSRGELHIQSPDPMAPPAIHPNYFGDAVDLEEMVRAAKMTLRIVEEAPLSELIEKPVGQEFRGASEAALVQHIQETAWTVFHPSCTCRMGKDAATSVVDASLRVHGLKGLRIVDASVFPNITSGNINAPVIMLAERGSDLILKEEATS